MVVAPDVCVVAAAAAEAVTFHFHFIHFFHIPFAVSVAAKRFPCTQQSFVLLRFFPHLLVFVLINFASTRPIEFSVRQCLMG